MVAVPWGGPEFLRLLALFAGSFIATCCIILGAWYLVLRPEPAPDAQSKMVDDSEIVWVHRC